MSFKSHPNLSMIDPYSASVLPHIRDLRIHTHRVCWYPISFKSSRIIFAAWAALFCVRALHGTIKKSRRRVFLFFNHFPNLHSQNLVSGPMGIKGAASFQNIGNILKRQTINSFSVYNFKNHANCHSVGSGQRRCLFLLALRKDVQNILPILHLQGWARLPTQPVCYKQEVGVLSTCSDDLEVKHQKVISEEFLTSIILWSSST